MPDEDGLIEFVEPIPDDNSSTTLLIVAEIHAESWAISMRKSSCPPNPTASSHDRT
jgi:hypothetical protein